MGRASWDIWFLQLAEHMSKRSKDPSTQTGAVIADPQTHRIISAGYNGFSRYMRDEPILYGNRDEKYPRIIHAEMNAILQATDNLYGYTLYQWPGPSCDRCAVHIIQAGIKRVVNPVATADMISRWGDHFKRSVAYFKEAGVEVCEYTL